MRLLLEIPGGYVEVADDRRLRAALHECRDRMTKRAETVIDGLGQDALAAAADVECVRFIGVARSPSTPLGMTVEPRPAPGPRIVFCEDAAGDTFAEAVARLDGYVVDVVDESGGTTTVKLGGPPTPYRGLSGRAFEDGMEGDPVAIPVAQVAEVRVW